MYRLHRIFITFLIFIPGGILTSVATLAFIWGLLIPKPLRGKIMLKIAGRPFIRAYCALFLPFQVYRNGYDNIPLKPRNFLMISNHLSYLDIPLLFKEFGYMFLLKASLRYSPFGLGAILLGGIALNRGDLKDRNRAIKEVVNTVRTTIPMHVFPEGTRSRTGEVLPFHRGLLAKMYREKIPILACGMWGTQLSFPADSLIMNPLQPVAISIHDLVKPEDYAKPTEFVEACQHAVIESVAQSKSRIETGSFTLPYVD